MAFLEKSRLSYWIHKPSFLYYTNDTLQYRAINMQKQVYIVVKEYKQPVSLPLPATTLRYIYNILHSVPNDVYPELWDTSAIIARTHGCVRNDNETRETETGLHDRRSRECNPSTPVECVSLSFRTHPCVLAFITHILCINGIEMTFVCLIQYTLLYLFFTFEICFIAL